MASTDKRWRLLERLGAGGMGEVFRAVATGPVATVAAVKRIRPELRFEPAFARVFLAEVRLMARLRHPAFVEVLDIYELDGHLHLVMELVDGASLARLLAAARSRRDPMPERQVAWLGWELCDALATAHAFEALGLVHRDLSPENVMLAPTGRVALLDFGIAKATLVVSDEKTLTNLIKGKAPYVSPEQADGRPLDGRSDVFALGSLLYECLAGERAFRGCDPLDTLRLVRAAAPRPLPPSELTAVVTSMMARDLSDRPTAAAAAHRLRPLVHHLAGDSEGMGEWVERLLPHLAESPPEPTPPTPLSMGLWRRFLRLMSRAIS